MILKEKYCNEIVPSMMDQHGFPSIMHTPRLLSVSLNVGCGLVDKKRIDYVRGSLTAIAAQRPVITRARKSVAGFKIRSGMPVGVSVILRRARMYDFLARFLYIALPRSRDFRGFSVKSFDGHGNYSFGIKECMIFQEVDYGSMEDPFGIDVTLVTSTSNEVIALDLLTRFGFPFMSKR